MPSEALIGGAGAGPAAVKDVTTATFMTEVVDDIVVTTSGHVDLLLATHEHWDHLSGFIQAAESFRRLRVGEVWLAWTEDPTDALATQLRGERKQVRTRIEKLLGQMELL